MSLTAKRIFRQQAKLACELLEHTLWEIPEEELHHPLKGERSAAWHIMHCATWVSIVGECYKEKLEPYVYPTTLKPEYEPIASDVSRTLGNAKNRSLQHLDKLTDEDLMQTILPPFPMIKDYERSPMSPLAPHSLIMQGTQVSAISRLKLWIWLPHFLDFQRGFIAGQLQFNPHQRRIEEFL